jgi:phosphoglycolate phosphatase-like HAD superfamily hydrolase
LHHLRIVVYVRRLNRKLFLFDIDGTLLASGGAGIRALEAATQELFQTTNLEGIEIAGRTDSAIARQLYARIGHTPTPEDLTRYYDRYLTHLAHFLPITDGTLLPGIIELLDTLRARPDCVLALLTGNLERGAKLKLTQYGVWHYFEFGAYADDHHDRNQLGPFAQSRAKEKHGVEFAPDDIFVLGDTPHDITCARAIGAKAVAIATGRQTRAELAEFAPDFLFDDLGDVPAVLATLGL